MFHLTYLITGYEVLQLGDTLEAGAVREVAEGPLNQVILVLKHLNILNAAKKRSKQKVAAASKNEQQSRVPTELPPLQIVLTKCDLMSQVALARRIVQVREQLSDCLVRQPKMLPEMLVSAQIEGQGGVLELQKELASLCGADFQEEHD